MIVLICLCPEYDLLRVVDIEEIIGHTDTKIISDNHLAMLVKQMAVHADVSTLTIMPCFLKWWWQQQQQKDAVL